MFQNPFPRKAQNPKTAHLHLIDLQEVGKSYATAAANRPSPIGLRALTAPAARVYPLG
jgi:hypothetical protein